MDFSSPVYDAARARLRARFGESAEEWWRALPAAVAELSHLWEFTVNSPAGRGNTSLVLRCVLVDGSAAMLKLIPDRRLAEGEATSLASWAPSGRVPAVWAHDADLGALLLEAIERDTPISEGTADVRPSEIADLIRALHEAGAPVIGHGVVSLAERVEFVFEHWADRYRRRPEVTAVVPLARLERGHELARLLVDGAAAPVLLHGDLHPGNVLDGGGSRGLVAIDPRPCVVLGFRCDARRRPGGPWREPRRSRAAACPSPVTEALRG